MFFKNNITICNIILFIILFWANPRNNLRHIFKFEQSLKKADLQTKAFFANIKTIIIPSKFFKIGIVFNKKGLVNFQVVQQWFLLIEGCENSDF